MFNLIRPNVLPLDDTRLVNTVSQNYFGGEPVTRNKTHKVVASWEP